ncbi:protein kinase domain-containing protein [Pseudonocardia zijingensis]|uniref:Protein kinase domain-containing protein n=1 Tax=Pseudonocardia zijingensis TaxID=153376 RepID=A0ABN1P013_9PSEU
MDPLGAGDPKRVGPYRLLGRLGAGGMGQVFLGRDRAGVQVAVKVVHSGYAHDERFRLRFRREVEISRTVTGPWVAAVVDADPDARTPWLATQYVHGPSLDAAVRSDGPLPAGEVHALAHGLARALAVVHDAGLVHRDLKPSNVLLGSDHPRLIDFGISRAIDATQVTSTGVVVGTPAFMSPEQIAGEDVGPASDVFSLGSVLVFAATGHNPFGDHPPLALMMRISGHEPDLDGVPDDLRGPIAACLAKQPQERPAAGELTGLFGTVVDAAPRRVVAAGGGAPTLVPAPTRVATEVPPPDGAPPLSRRAWLGIAGAAALLGAGGFGLAAALGSPRAKEARWAAPASSVLDHPAVAVDEGSVYVYGGDAMRALDSATGEERWSVPGWAEHESIDLARIAAAGGAVVVGTSTGVTVLEAATGRRMWDVPGQITTFAAADGILVTAASGEGLRAQDLVSGRRVWGSDQSYVQASIAYAGMHIAIEIDEVVARELRSGRQLWRYPAGSYDSYRLAGADGVVAVGSSVTATLLDAATGQQLWRASQSVQRLLITGDVLVLLVQLGEQVAVRAFDLARGEPRWALPEIDGRLPQVLGADGIVYFRPTEGPTSAYDARSGDRIWVYDGDTNTTREPVAARGRDLYLFDKLEGGRIQAVAIP